jgi:hypothetical protein
MPAPQAGLDPDDGGAYGMQARGADDNSGDEPYAPGVPVLRMAYFPPGAEVEYRGRRCTVSHTVLRRGELRVKLREEMEDVSPDLLLLPLTSFALTRVH